jgi:predicted dithiol-disulfide oxidoreductase (DUF899 family)
MSDMALAQIAAYKQRKGRTVPFCSSRGTPFSDDCGAGRGFALSAFLRDGDGVYRTYFTNSRGVDRLRLDLNIFYLARSDGRKNGKTHPNGWPRTETTSP